MRQTVAALAVVDQRETLRGQLVEAFGHLRDWLFDSCAIPSWATSFSTRRVDTPSG